MFFTITGINFFNSIPESIIEYAHIDGAKEIQIFGKIIIPVSLPFVASAFFVCCGRPLEQLARFGILCAG